jgi:Transglycosylase
VNWSGGDVGRDMNTDAGLTLPRDAQRDPPRALNASKARRLPFWSAVEFDLARIRRKVSESPQAASPALTLLEQLVLVLEDRRYFSHSGVDLRSCIRETVRALELRKFGGASTIEMQLVRTVTGYKRNTLRRKLYEMLLAVALRHRHGKVQILRTYLACAFFGTDLIGADAASARVFGKPAGLLCAEEAAFIAAMLARPRPLVPAPAWEKRVRRRAQYGLRIWAAKPWSWPQTSDETLPLAHSPRTSILQIIDDSEQPPPADEGPDSIQVLEGRAVGPRGIEFATARNSGFVSQGVMTPTEYLKRIGSFGEDAPPSTLRVVQAVSRNEGRFEAVNSYDSSVLSFGIFQWTVGPGDRPGELAGLLHSVRCVCRDAFDECFGRYDLGVALEPGVPDWPRIGYLTLGGLKLDTRDSKQELRRAHWAYRFWRAGHDNGIRRCQLDTAMARIQTFYHKQVCGRSVADWISSEYGVALLLDQHVNQPAHVLETLRRAIAQLPAPVAVLETSRWGDHHEQALIDLYIRERNGTAMTTPADRAARIKECIRDGGLSFRRGSFRGPAKTSGARLHFA